MRSLPRRTRLALIGALGAVAVLAGAPDALATPLPTITAVSSNHNPVSAGPTSVLYTVTVKPSSGSGTPTGTVALMNGGNPMNGCGKLPLSTGSATCGASATLAGADQITAVYSGDPTFAASFSPVLTEWINGSATATETTVTAGPGYTQLGMAVTYIAQVTDSTGPVPKGNVDFTSSGNPITSPTGPCSAVPLSNGYAVCTTSYSQRPSSDDVTATFVPIPPVIYAGSSSDVTHAISNLPVSAKVSAEGPVTPVAGQTMVYTATVTSATTGFTPTGTVTFNASGTALCSTVALSSGIAKCTTTATPVGANAISATYSGDALFAATVSPTLAQQVNPAGTVGSLLPGRHHHHKKHHNGHRGHHHNQRHHKQH